MEKNLMSLEARGKFISIMMESLEAEKDDIWIGNEVLFVTK